jgi:hypothetical protein
LKALTFHEGRLIYRAEANYDAKLGHWRRGCHRNKLAADKRHVIVDIVKRDPSDRPPSFGFGALRND